MNTKTDGISSGLVAVAWREETGYERPFWMFTVDESQTRPNIRKVEPLVRLSDAEAIIAQKDAEIIEQCRLNGMGAERELALLGQIERQSAALKLAKELLPKRIPNGFVSFGKYYAEQEDLFADPYNKMSKFKKSYLTRCEEVLAAINEVIGEGNG